jgi:hypothetical protein
MLEVHLKLSRLLAAVKLLTALKCAIYSMICRSSVVKVVSTSQRLVSAAVGQFLMNKMRSRLHRLWTSLVYNLLRNYVFSHLIRKVQILFLISFPRSPQL